MAKASHKANDEDGLDPRCREIDYLLMEAASKSHPRDMDAGRGSVVAIFCNLPLGAKAEGTHARRLAARSRWGGKRSLP